MEKEAMEKKGEIRGRHAVLEPQSRAGVFGFGVGEAAGSVPQREDRKRLAMLKRVRLEHLMSEN